MSATVLVLDNDAALRELLKMALGSEGLEVLAAADGEEATALLAERPVDLLLLDLNLAAGDCGLARARAWAEAGRLPAFFAVTGTPDDPRLTAMEEIDRFLGVIAKPFSILALIEQVQAAAAPDLAGPEADPPPPPEAAGEPADPAAAREP